MPSPLATLVIKLLASSYYFLVYEESPEAASNKLVNLSLDILVFTPSIVLSFLKAKLLETPSESPDTKAFAASREKSKLSSATYLSNKNRYFSYSSDFQSS